ncbi:MAG: adenosylcobinamide amidohydrolase [Nitrospira sp.]|nr:adenosylcobinamide amidohydrolase [Nitrospira sp.]
MNGRQPNRFVSQSRVARDTLIVDLGTRMRVLSSAPRGGGFRTTRFILNHQVPSNPSSNVGGKSWEDPSRYLRRLAGSLGVEPHCVGLMTAVPMTQVVSCREERNGLWVECFATVGVTNAVRAGEPPSDGEQRSRHGKAGTINLIVVTNACLAAPALVGAVQVATESKTGVLRDHAVPSWTGAPGATGTGTDAVVAACALRGRGPWHAYAGTHTELGSMIGLVVGECVVQGLARAAQWKVRHRS